MSYFCCFKTKSAAPPKYTPSDDREIKAAVLTRNPKGVFVDHIKVALESFRNASWMVHESPYDLLKDLEEDKKANTPSRYNIVLIDEQHDYLMLKEAIKEVNLLTKDHQATVIYFSDKAINPIDLAIQKSPPNDASAGEMFKIFTIFSNTFPKAEKQDPTTIFYPRTKSEMN